MFPDVPTPPSLNTGGRLCGAALTDTRGIAGRERGIVGTETVVRELSGERETGSERERMSKQDGLW
jgi:hypothetical protein